MSDAAPQAKMPQVVRSHRAMDTAFTITIQSADAALATSAAEAAFARIDAIESLLSRFNDTSDVALIAALRPGEVGVVALETMCALTASARVCEATGGAFDPTVGPVMRRLKKTGMAWDAIPPDVLEDAFARGGMQRLVLDVEHLRVSVKADRLGRDTPLELDFGGIGKGVALDECAKVLEGEQFEMTDYLLDAGTSTQLMRGGPWRIGVGGEWKGRTRQQTVLELRGGRIGVGGEWKGRTRQQTVLELRGGAVSGSGFTLQGAHVVDVRRKTAARRWAHAWSRAASATVADALSTAALSMDAAELERACKTLDARILVAHNQKKAMDLLRDPLKWFGSPIGIDKTA